MSIPPAPHDRPHPDPYDTRTIDLNAAEVGLDAGAAASELVIHGLLEFHRHLDSVARDARIARVLQAINAETAPLTFSFRSPRVLRWAAAAAAVLAILVGVLIFGVPGESSALAQVQHSIAALRSPGDRRYEVRVLSWTDQDAPADPHATIDMRSPYLLIVRHRPPWSPTPVIVGRDALGEWAIRADGGIERDNPRQYWPPWSVDDRSLIVDSLDRVLEQLPSRYNFTREPDAPLDGHGPAPLTRVAAVRADAAGPLPHRVEIWIDPATQLVERMEFSWSTPQRDPDPSRSAPPGGHAGPSLAGVDRGPGDGPRPSAPSHPKLIVFDRVNAPQHPDGWFTPQRHPKP